MMKNPMTCHRVLYEQRQLPTFQNRMYDTRQEALACPKGDVTLVENLETGLVYNAAFDSGLMVYDEHYQNEQAHSPRFQAHLESVSEIVVRSPSRLSSISTRLNRGNIWRQLASRCNRPSRRYPICRMALSSMLPIQIIWMKSN